MNNRKNPFVIGVEGIIGAGKTTFIDVCLAPLLSSKGYNVKVVREPVDLWLDILPLFYENPERWGYFFQTKALTDRVNVINEVMSDKNTKYADIIICERGVVSDCIFMEIMKCQSKITDMEYRTYKSLWEIVVRTVSCIPDMFVYISPSIEEAMKRVKSRNRNGEQDLEFDYQKMLMEKHNHVFDKNNVKLGNKMIPVLKLETELNFRDDMDVKRYLVNIVEQRINQIKHKC